MTLQEIQEMASMLERSIEDLSDSLTLDAQAVVELETLPTLYTLRCSLHRIEDVDGKSFERRLSL